MWCLSRPGRAEWKIFPNHPPCRNFFADDPPFYFLTAWRGCGRGSAGGMGSDQYRWPIYFNIRISFPGQENIRENADTEKGFPFLQTGKPFSFGGFVRPKFSAVLGKVTHCINSLNRRADDIGKFSDGQEISGRIFEFLDFSRNFERRGAGRALKPPRVGRKSPFSSFENLEIFWTRNIFSMTTKRSVPRKRA